MKLTSMQVSRTLRQFEARAIPENHPIISQLSGLFGEHTFLLDRNGLNATSRRALAIWSVAKLPPQSTQRGLITGTKGIISTLVGRDNAGDNII
jgi:hypothetical protein